MIDENIERSEMLRTHLERCTMLQQNVHVFQSWSTGSHFSKSQNTTLLSRENTVEYQVMLFNTGISIICTDKLNGNRI
jgi:hypothetical protein